MDFVELLASTFSSLIVAGIILYISMRYTSISRFNSAIKGLEYEIQVNAENLNAFQSRVQNAEFPDGFALKELRLREYLSFKWHHSSYDYCIINGYLWELPLFEQEKINQIYQIPELINEFLSDRVRVCPTELHDELYYHLNTTCTGLLTIIEEHNQIKDKITFAIYYKKFWKLR